MNKNFSKRRPRGRPKKRRGKDRLPKRKETSKRDDEEEEIKTESIPPDDCTPEENEAAEMGEDADFAHSEESAALGPTEVSIAITEPEVSIAVTQPELSVAVAQPEASIAVTQTDVSTAVTQTEDAIAIPQAENYAMNTQREPSAIISVKHPMKLMKEEMKDDDESLEERPSLSMPSLSLDTSASTSSTSPEAVVAQLNQLQETVVSHILQYQAGVMAQFQQLQQQMLSELNNSSSNQPQVTVTPIVKKEPISRKRRASARLDSSYSEEEGSKNGEVLTKRKRTAFSEKQYEILETTFQHNNFPEPIDQHCIALRIKTPYRSIKMWFQNRRASIRKRMNPKDKVTEEETTDKKAVKNNCDPDARWYCPVCPSTFISKKFLDSHREAHEKETINCPSCNMSFTHKVLLDTHKISKCTSISGVDLSHLEDERKELHQSHDKINFIKALSKDPKCSKSTSVSTASLPILLPKLQKQQPKKEEKDLSSPPPLVDPNSLNPLPAPKQENQVFVQQQRLMQQLLLAQLQQAAQLKAKQESEEQEAPKEAENPNGSLTLGGLTIFPVKANNKVPEVKEEVKQSEELTELQPSTLQDQIASILHNQGLKSALKSDDDDELKSGTRESMKEQIQAILRHQEEQRKKSLKMTAQGNGVQDDEAMDLESLKRHRRRTTVFNEVQLRTLYMHFTHCNFPDPAMFKIIGHLVKLDPQVIKIWFQNERSRQRKRAMHIVDEVSAKDKPYKCKDCGMSFAMMTFLVKHSMRHIGETDQDANVRTCPLCLQKWNKEVFSSHLKSRHNVNLSLVEERSAGSLKCYLCSESFPDQENLMIHKHKHLKDEYGDPPQCTQCKTTFVNAICLEAHMESHETAEWTHKCNLCGAVFHDKMLLTSHEMGHGVPLAPVSTIDRSRSQLQHSNIRSINALARKTVASAIESLNKPPSENVEEQSSDSEVAKSEKSILSIKTNMLCKTVGPECKTVVVPDCKTGVVPECKTNVVGPECTTVIPECTSLKGKSSKSVSTSTSAISTVVANMNSPTISTAPVNNMVSPPTGPVSYVKLIPVQLIPTNPVPNSQTGTAAAGVITGPTTAFLSVPVNFVGPNETACNPVFNQLFDASAAAKMIEEKGSKKKSLPNLIPINEANVVVPKVEVEEKDKKLNISNDVEKEEKIPNAPTTETVEKDEKKSVPDLLSSPVEDEIQHLEKKGVGTQSDLVLECDKPSPQEEKMNAESCEQSTEDKDVADEKVIPEEKASSEEQSPQQAANKKRYVPILPLLPLQLSEKEQKSTSTNTPETPSVPLRPKSSRNVPNKRLWEAYKVDGYKRRRTPTYFTGSQREILEAHFDHDNFPDPEEQVTIADQLGVNYPVVKTWFQNTRKNFRKNLKTEKVNPSGGPFHCQRCNVAFISDSSLAEHKDVHDVVTGIKCQECDLNYAHESVLKTHHIVNHKNAKLGDSIRRKKYGVDILERFSSQVQYDGDNEEVSDSDSQDEGVNNDECVKKEFMEVGGTPQRIERGTPEDSMDGEDYHPIMAVECILDNSEGEDEVQKWSDSPEQCGHKCCSCGESFASLIALKEHNSHHCASQATLKPGHFRRRKKWVGKRKNIGNNIRCCECYNIFSDRNSYLEHFRSFPCTSSRQRIEYTDEEQKVLLTHYDGNNFPLPSEMSLLARRLGVRYRQVMHWFQNRRSKERKKLKEGGKLPPVECLQCKASFVTEDNLNRHKKIVHSEGDGGNNLLTEVGSPPSMMHACNTPGCGAFFPNAELLLTHSLAHQIDTDAMQAEEENDSHKLPNFGPTSLWKDFAVLEAHYSDNNFPDPMDIGFIARRLQVDPLHVHLWFKERRNQHIRKLEENGSKVMEGEAPVSTQKALSKVCTKCDAAFICQADLESHEDMHKSSWAQVCSMCGLEFSNVVVLETHWIRHGIEVSKDKRHSPERPTKASFTNAQMEVLDTHYEHNNFPMALEIWLIAMRLNLRPRQVTHWFQNKRGRDRRVHKLVTAYSRICAHCGASFICDLFLTEHLKVHKSDERHTCPDCKVIYLSPVLLETHALYHTSIPKDKVPRRSVDGVKDPITEGQVKSGTISKAVTVTTEEQSDSSEGELKIDESEDYTICIENNEDEMSNNTRGEDTEEDEAELPDAEYESFIESEVEESNPSIADTAADQPPAAAESDAVKNSETQINVEEKEMESLKVNPVIVGKPIREEVFFDDSTDSDDEEDEPRLRIVSAYTMTGDPVDIECDEEEEDL